MLFSHCFGYAWVSLPGIVPGKIQVRWQTPLRSAGPISKEGLEPLQNAWLQALFLRC
jgi:hypothetical protein